MLPQREYKHIISQGNIGSVDNSSLSNRKYLIEINSGTEFKTENQG